jgi:general stress protein 26
MDKSAVIGAAEELVSAGRSFVLATVDQDGAPQVRWMGAVFTEKPFTMYLAAGAESRKMAQISGNPKSQLMFHAEDFSKVATLSGTSEIVDDDAVKQQVFAGLPAAAQYFSGPDDPSFGVVKFEAKKIEMLGLSEGMRVDSVEL